MFAKVLRTFGIEFFDAGIVFIVKLCSPEIVSADLHPAFIA